MVSLRHNRSRALTAIAIMAFLLLRSAAAAEINVRVDRDPAPLNKSFQIAFETADDVDGDPDFAPLNKDFQVLSRAQSNNFSMINGKTTRSRGWKLTVLARRAGRLTIPPISFGRDRSQAYPITVADAAGAPSAGTGRPESGEVFLEVEAKPLRTWVQGQVIYTVRLYRAVQTANEGLSEPEVENGAAVIEKLGKDRGYDTQVMGRDYSVVERSYAIYPQASGTVTVRPLQFQGQTGRMPFSLLDPFGPQPETLVRQSAPVALEVAPIPGGFTGDHWLPARQVRLNDEWSRDPPQFHVGEPITRTVTLTADGLTAGQLPELPAWVPAGFKSYPDQPALHDAKSPAGIIGTRQEKTALIPSRPGDYTLPEIRIAWWNTASGKVEQALLPAQEIHVLPSADGQTTDVTGSTATAPQTAAGVEPSGAQPQPSAPVVPVGPTAMMDRRLWQGISLVLATGWLITLAWFWRRSRQGTLRPQSALEKPPAAVRELQQACAIGDAARAKDALLRWARLTWKERAPVSIGELQYRCGEEFARELGSLNNALYARSGGNWDGRALWRAFAAEPRSRQESDASRHESLEPLHRI